MIKQPAFAMRIINGNGLTIQIGQRPPQHYTSNDVAEVLKTHYADLPEYLDVWERGWFHETPQGWVYLPF